MVVSFEFGLDKDKNVVNINQVTSTNRHTEYRCANKQCNGVFVPKIKGAKKAKHFAHKCKVFNHAGESILHYNTKLAIFNILIRKFAQRADEKIKYYDCMDVVSQYNILIDADVIDYEVLVTPEYKPDICIISYNKDGIVDLTKCVFIEIIVTHDINDVPFEIISKNRSKLIKIYTNKEYYNHVFNKSLMDSLFEGIIYPYNESIKIYNFHEDGFVCSSCEFFDFDGNRDHPCSFKVRLKELVDKVHRLNDRNVASISQKENKNGDIIKLSDTLGVYI